MSARSLSRIAALAGAALLLAGCKDESASMIFTGPDHALTLNARQPWPWSKGFELEVVMARQPDCQRRSRLGSAPSGEIRVEVFRPPEGVYAEPIVILRQGGRHYAVSGRNCEMQPFGAAPQEMGARLGGFDREGGKLKFVAAPKPAAPPPLPVPAATPAQALPQQQ